MCFLSPKTEANIRQSLLIRHIGRVTALFFDLQCLQIHLVFLFSTFSSKCAHTSEPEADAFVTLGTDDETSGDSSSISTMASRRSDSPPVAPSQFDSI